MKYKLLLLLMVVSNFSFSQNADEIVKNADLGENRPILRSPSISIDQSGPKN